MADIVDIETNAKNPKRVSVDGEAVEQNSLPDQIKADQYLNNKATAAAGGQGIRLSKIVPGNTV